jgi:hypothetical protein
MVLIPIVKLLCTIRVPDTHDRLFHVFQCLFNVERERG